MPDYHLVEGNCTDPLGFAADAVNVDVKGNGGTKPDVGVIFSLAPAVAAGVFTTNAFCAAPVQICRARITAAKARAILFNSGNANACTGEQGLTDAETTARALAEHLGIPNEQVLTTSTGVIGVPLPVARIVEGIRRLRPTSEGGHTAAIGIMTTDTRPKEAAACLTLHGRTVTIGGMAKGSGMIHPNMATLLAFITTDAQLTPAFAQAVLKRVADATFNMLTVDGDTSTNDSLLLLANGQAGGVPLSGDDPDSLLFETALLAVAENLTVQLARDGEGATKVIEATVRGAASVLDAQRTARAIVQSPLVKTAVYGADPNWGRIGCAVGYSGAAVNPDRVAISVEHVQLMVDGRPVPFDKVAVTDLIRTAECVHIEVDLQLGTGNAQAWGCDLTEEYVHINADYTT